MKKDEFIRYFIDVMEQELNRQFPSSINEDYIVPEMDMVDFALEIMQKKCIHIKEGMRLSYIIDQKKEKKCGNG